MPSNIKKFTLTYNLIPKVFSLPEQLYLNYEKIASSTPANVSEQTAEQKEYITSTIKQIDLDADRTCYVDFTGLKASQLKAEWLTRNLSDEVRITPGVFPTFTQGDNTSACISEILHTTQVISPLSTQNSDSLAQLMTSTKRICFAYRTDNGESAGFSLIASPSGDADGNHKGWIISTIQNTTGQYNKRKITVLASSNYVSTKTARMIAMDNPTSIETELKDALNNDKVVKLIKRIFNPDGSLNEIEMKRLKSRIHSSINIDDRNRKEAQLNCLHEWLQQRSNTDLQGDIATEDIDFFQDGIYEFHLKKKLGTLAAVLHQNSNITKTISELTLILNNISARVAHFEMLAEESYRNIELANTYKALAKRIKLKTASITFDGTQADENKITWLSQLDITQLDKKIKNFYATDPTVKKYYEHKKLSNQKIQEKLTQTPNPENNSFLSRNSFSLGFGASSGLFTAAALGFILFELFPPLTLTLILVGTAVIIGGVLSAVDIYINEKEHAEKTIEYQGKVSKIKLEHNQQLQIAEQNLQKRINLDELLEPDKPEFLSTLKNSKRKPLTPEKVAHALWLNDKDAKSTSIAKNKFALWAATHEELGFGIVEVNHVIQSQYEMHS
ncbi:hypothetical protein [Legionella sainthelensi]|uniref:hypothetical protein n=1 Tax=Legionella sainthelensi TaxID=28087 RepID=UPI000E1FF528|nr:hypothetical protein [Legionella sainthelensi]